jgi:hypothetical protein
MAKRGGPKPGAAASKSTRIVNNPEVGFMIPEGWFAVKHAGKFEWTPELREWAKDLWMAGVWWMLPFLIQKSTPLIVPGAVLCASFGDESRPSFDRYSYADPDRFEGIAFDHPLSHQQLDHWAYLIPPVGPVERFGLACLDIVLSLADALFAVHQTLQDFPEDPRSGVGEPAIAPAGMHQTSIQGIRYFSLATDSTVWPSRELPPPLTWFAICGALSVELRRRMRPLCAQLDFDHDAPAIREFALRLWHPVRWTPGMWELLHSIRRELDRFEAVLTAEPRTKPRQLGARASLLPHPDGWTRMELVRQVRDVADLPKWSPTTFDRVRVGAKVASFAQGGVGTNSRYGIVEVKKLVNSLRNGRRFRDWDKIAAALEQMIPV